MIYSVCKRIFTGLLSIICFFAAQSDARKVIEVPTGAERIDYAATQWGNMILFLPETTDAQTPTDVLFTIHGGAWVSGTAKIFYEDCRAAAEAGYIAVAMNYDKIFNGATAADMVNEIDTAIAALKAELDSRGIRYGKLILAGHSAGAHIMLLYAYTRYETCPIEIAFVVSCCAPSDFLDTAKKPDTMVGLASYLIMSGLTKELITPLTAKRNADAIRALAPIAQITPDVPPTIVVQGTKDKLIPYRCSVDLYDALQKNGVDSVHITYEGAGHFLGRQYTEANAAFRNW